MVSRSELVEAADRAFAKTSDGLQAWPDPHPHRAPSDEEYSRVTDAAKWRIVGARAEAWLEVVEGLSLARIERDASVTWVAKPGTRISTVDRATPPPGALPLVVAHSGVGDVDDAGVTFGVGDPAVCVTWVPACGCDACDSGSQNELDQVDQIMLSVISGSFRRLSSGDRLITQFDETGWSASGIFGRREVDAVLDDPTGWEELSGTPWTHFV